MGMNKGQNCYNFYMFRGIQSSIIVIYNDGSPKRRFNEKKIRNIKIKLKNEMISAARNL